MTHFSHADATAAGLGRGAPGGPPAEPGQAGRRHRDPRRGSRLNGYLAQRVPSLFLASSFRMCLDV